MALLFILIFAKSVSSFRCVQRLNSCSCVTNVYGWIFDLSPLEDGGYNPTFSAESANNSYRYLKIFQILYTRTNVLQKIFILYETLRLSRYVTYTIQHLAILV